MKGKVQWFDDGLGYGFILSTDDDNVYFIHFSEINTDGYASLEKDDLVEFEPSQNQKGLQAMSVNIVKKKRKN